MEHNVTTVPLDPKSRPTTIELPRLRLVVTRGPAVGVEAILEESRIVIGKSPGSDFRIDDPAVSRRHCELVLESDGFLLRDLDSRNGTSINGVWIREAYLQPGGAFEIGSSLIEMRPLDERVEIPLYEGDAFGGVLGWSIPMRRTMALLDRVASKPTSVLLNGETGTGKEVIARALHDESPRAALPFVTVDCGSLQQGLIDSELFGHVDGAFTGATGERSSVFEDAKGGTVFLDEIGELPLEQQSRLLRVLESREIKRLGENEPRPVDFRLIAATHRDLAEDVEDGTFRQDLYFRLSVVELRIPPLRERPEDIELYAERFLSDIAESTDSTPLKLSHEGLSALKQHSWPGNVRELRNVIERAYAVSGPGDTEIDSNGILVGAVRVAAPTETAFPMNVPYDTAQKQFERAYLLTLLERTDRKIPKAAAEMGVRRQSLYRMLKRHGIKP